MRDAVCGTSEIPRNRLFSEHAGGLDITWKCQPNEEYDADILGRRPGNVPAVIL